MSETKEDSSQNQHEEFIIKSIVRWLDNMDSEFAAEFPGLNRIPTEFLKQVVEKLLEELNKKIRFKLVG